MNAPAMIGPSAEEREMIRDAVRGVLQQSWPVENYAANDADPAAQAALWQALCAQGIACLGSDPETGGLREVATVMEEMGRGGATTPLMAAVYANLLLARRKGQADVDTLLDGIAAGTIVLAVAQEADGGAVTVRDGRASGTAEFVERADIATHLLLLVGEGHGGFAVVDMARGASVEATRAMGTGGWFRVSLDGADTRVFAAESQEIAVLHDVGRIAHAARAYGACRRVFDLLVPYARERKQFGKPIGSFQAIQHKLVNTHIALNGADESVRFAAAAYDRDDEHWRYFAAAAFSAAQGLMKAAMENHHAFGGVGYAEEHEAPRHFKHIHLDLARHGGGLAARRDLGDFFLGRDDAAFPAIDLGEQGNAFREEVRAWMQKNWADDLGRAFADGTAHHDYSDEFAHRLGHTGWLALNWPKQFGGLDKSAIENIAFLEMQYGFDAPRTGSPIQASMFMVHGTPEQQERYLPELREGRVHYGMGYSEPNSGSDLASLKTRAVRDGDDWVIDGQKIWCTSYHGDYLLVATRTDPDAQPVHKGITAFVVPTNAPGLTIRPTGTMYDGTFANLFFDGVRIPDSARVGEVNGGWAVITGALATERGIVGGIITMQTAHFFALACEYFRSDPAMRNDPLLRDMIGRYVGEIEVGRRMMVACAESAVDHVTPPAQAAMAKVYSGEVLERLAAALLEYIGPRAALSKGAAGAILAGRLELRLRWSLMWVISIGTNEIQRNLIAKLGLDLPSR